MAAKKKNLRVDTIQLETKTVQAENPSNVYNLYSSEFANPTPDNFKYYLDTLYRGLLFWAYTFFTHLRKRDLHIKAVCQTRKLPIIAKQWIVEAFKREGDEKPAPEQIEAVEFFEDLFSQDWFIQFISDIVEAQISGLSIFELNYYTEDDRVKLKPELIPNSLVIYDDKQNKYFFLQLSENDVFKLRNLGWQINSTDRIDLSKIKYIDLPELKKLEVHSIDGGEGNGLLNGFIDGLMWAYMKRNLASKDWAIYLEKHADPPVSAAYDPLTAEQGRAKAWEAVKMFGRSKAAVFPSGMEFKIHDESNKSGTSQLFKEYITEIKEEISIAILGQTLTTSVGDKGTQALGTVHDKVRGDLQQADMILVAMTVNRIVKILCDLNFPNLEKYPRFTFKALKDIEFLKSMAVIIRDLRVAGFKTKADKLAELFDLPFEETTAVGAAVDENQNNDNSGNDNNGNDEKKNDNKNDEQKSDEDKFKELLKFAEKLSKKKLEAEMEKYLKEFYKEGEAV